MAADCEGEIAHCMKAAFTSRIETEAPPQDFLFERFPKWTLAHWCIVIFAASFLILAMHPEARLNDFDVPNGAEPVRVARWLAARSTFSDPFAALPTGTTAHVAPVYPFLYSLVLRAFGTGYRALLTAWACNVAFFALQMGLLLALSYQLHLGALPGIIAAALGTFSLHTPIDTRTECFLAGALLLVSYLLTDRAFGEKNIALSFVAGGLWGVLILTNPVMVVLLLAWPLCFLLQHRAAPIGYLRRSAVIVGLALLI